MRGNSWVVHGCRVHNMTIWCIWAAHCCCCTVALPLLYLVVIWSPIDSSKHVIAAIGHGGKVLQVCNGTWQVVCSFWALYAASCSLLNILCPVLFCVLFRCSIVGLSPFWPRTNALYSISVATIVCGVFSAGCLSSTVIVKQV